MVLIGLIGNFETLLELTNVTRKRLGDKEEASVIPWVVAQRISTSQKVELSIRYVQFQELCCCQLILFIQ